MLRVFICSFTTLLTFLLVFSACLCYSLAKPTVYVSVDGNDKWSGRLPKANKAGTDGPVAGLPRARNVLRELRAQHKLPSGEVVIELGQGIYEMPGTFELTSEDSGTAQSPVTIRGAAGKQVRLSAGKNLTGFVPVKDTALLNKLPAEARNHVLQTDLKAQGIVEYSKMVSAQTWAESEPGLELFFDEEPMTLARWPNSGYTKIVDVKGPTPVDVRGTVGTAEGIFTYQGDRPERWVNEPDVMVDGYWMWDWADQRFRVRTIDTSTRTITLDQPPSHVFGFRKGQWYYAYNLLPELDMPGEWYLDRQTGILYFWPPKEIKNARIAVSLHRDMITMDNVSYLNLHNLTLEYSQANGVVMREGGFNKITKCTVRNIAGAAVNIFGSTNNTVFGCDMYNLGNGGVNVYAGDRNTLTPGKNNVENCHVYKFGRWNPIYKPAVSLNGVGNRAAHNLFNDSPHMAIGISGNEQVIEYNEIHSVVYESNDAGALYGGRDWSMRGQQIRYNYFHDIYGFEGKGCVGVYLDDQFSSANIFGNIHVRVPMASFVGGGRDTTIENNIYIDCKPAIHIDARGLGWAHEGFENLKDRLNDVPYKSEPWRTKYPQLLTLLEDNPMAPKNLLIARNICVGGSWTDIEEVALPAVTFVDNIIDKDPLFVDAARGNYNLKPESPALKAGFKKIPFEKIGLYKHPLRASWPVKTEIRERPK